MLQRGDRRLFWEQDRMARSGASGRGGGRKGRLPPLRSRGKQAQGSRGEHGHQAALPPLVPPICGWVPRAFSPHLPLPSLPPAALPATAPPGGLRGDRRHITNPVAPSPPLVQTSELRQEPLPPGTRRRDPTEGRRELTPQYQLSLSQRQACPGRCSLNSHFLWGP